MPSWNDLLSEFLSQPTDADKGAWLNQNLTGNLQEVAALRGDTNVLLYGSAFLQKAQVPAPSLTITHEEVNGLMSVLFGMDYDKPLTLILHTPGGATNATESIVAYIRSKFDHVETIVPALAMSAGTMISLGSDRIVMGRQSQLGPIDPQMLGGGRQISARAVVEQFERAQDEIVGTPANPGNRDLAHVWAPILQSLGPSLLQEAQNALDYSESMVAQWLSDYMLRANGDRIAQGKAIANHFNDASSHKSHGRRIDRDEARAQGVLVDDLEDDQSLQEAVLTAYHVMTIAFEQGPATKMLWSHAGRTWMKNWVGPGAPN